MTRRVHRIFVSLPISIYKAKRGEWVNFNLNQHIYFFEQSRQSGYRMCDAQASLAVAPFFCYIYQRLLCHSKWAQQHGSAFEPSTFPPNGRILYRCKHTLAAHAMWPFSQTSQLLYAVPSWRLYMLRIIVHIYSACSYSPNNVQPWTKQSRQNNATYANIISGRGLQCDTMC